MQTKLTGVSNVDRVVAEIGKIGLMPATIIDAILECAGSDEIRDSLNDENRRDILIKAASDVLITVNLAQVLDPKLVDFNLVMDQLDLSAGADYAHVVQVAMFDTMSKEAVDDYVAKGLDKTILSSRLDYLRGRIVH